MPTITPTTIQEIKNQYNLLGTSQGLTDAVVRAMQVAPFDISVLVTGESGTGKETLPKIIHNLGKRKHKQYIAINCGAIPEGTIDSELFGHVKGAFTDASSDRQGHFEMADGGTIFLDEVAEMPLSTQARLLRVLENGEFMKVGSSVVQKTDIRIIAATNKDLLQAAHEGKFREDLYYRLSAVQIKLPALRERGKDDVTILARHFARMFADANHAPIVKFEPDAIAAMAAQQWPGNVRQLKNTVDQIALFHAGTRVDAATIARYLPDARSAAMPVPMGDNQHKYGQTIAVLFETIRGLIDRVKNLEAIVGAGEHSGAPTAFVSNNVSTLQRDLPQPVAHASLETADAFIERVYEDKTSPHTYEQYDEMVVDVPQVKTLYETEKETITEALKRNGGLRKRTADELNISERTLYRKIKQYELDKAKQR